jgi:hypothetical protein
MPINHFSSKAENISIAPRRNPVHRDMARDSLMQVNQADHIPFDQNFPQFSKHPSTDHHDSICEKPPMN